MTFFFLACSFFRRFCEHCLKVHLACLTAEDAGALSPTDENWSCPVCRKTCCCSISDCSQDHRHCKAYRYRRRRAEVRVLRAVLIFLPMRCDFRAATEVHTIAAMETATCRGGRLLRKTFHSTTFHSTHSQACAVSVLGVCT